MHSEETDNHSILVTKPPVIFKHRLGKVIIITLVVCVGGVIIGVHVSGVRRRPLEGVIADRGGPLAHKVVPAKMVKGGKSSKLRRVLPRCMWLHTRFNLVVIVRRTVCDGETLKVREAAWEGFDKIYRYALKVAQRVRAKRGAIKGTEKGIVLIVGHPKACIDGKMGKWERDPSCWWY
jgi:hypothetical protein